ncbi:hypothetical protein [Brevibacillus migulae]|uniref:hypothetical protein n=1 Tax=Brevibacillus migulae TaxID=1644114 RepID=UPI00106E7AE8|nr:hypothetical protein [Brevibacillus migulae]
MKKPFFTVVTLLLAVALASCSPPEDRPNATGQTPPPKNEEQTPPAAPETRQNSGSTVFVPLNPASMEEPAIIILNEEQRLRSPITTVVAPQPQTYTFLFKEAMDRASVQQALEQNAQKQTKEDPRNIVPQLSLQWIHDHKLEVTVNVPQANVPDFGNRAYRLDLSGAKTASGKTLTEAPFFHAVLYAPPQLWRISTDGKHKEKLHSFEKPYYSITSLDRDSRYLILSRFGEYCECDADYERLYALFDREQKKLTPYPFELSTHYRGPGAFVVDTRGFFYKKPAPDKLIPKSDTAIELQMKAFIHGAALSLDRQYVLMAVGAPTQTSDLDLLLYHVQTGAQQRFPKALKGSVPQSELNGEPLPVIFQDNGKQVTFTMQKEGEYKEIRYLFDWQSEKVSPWNPPIPDNAYSGYTASDDGAYHLFANGGLFRGDQSINRDLWEGHWIAGTHKLVYKDYRHDGPADSPYREQLKLYDADRLTTTILADNLFIQSNVVGVSPDGKWIYLQSHADLLAPMGK